MSWFVADLASGEVLIRDLPVKSGSVNPVLNRAGSISAVVRLPMSAQIGDRTVTIDPDILAPGKIVIGLEENGVILDAGPIWSRRFDFASNELTLSGAGLRSYFEHRYVLPANVASHSGSDSSFVNLSLRTIAKRVVQQAVAWTNGSVPVTFESDVTGTHERNYVGASLESVDYVLTKLSGVEGGPDIDFRPYFNDARTHVHWYMKTGNSELRQGGADWVWDMSLPSSSVRGASLTSSAEQLASHVWETGGYPEGAAEPIVAAASSSQLASFGYPMMEIAENRGSVITLDVLQGHANAAVVTGAQLIQQYEFEASTYPVMALPDGREVKSGPWLGEFRVGDYARLVLGENSLGAWTRPRIRLLGYSYSGGDSIRFTCAESRSDV